MDWTALDQVTAFMATYGLNVLGGIVLLIVGWLFAGWAYRTMRRVLARSRRIDATLQGFFASLVRYVILALVIVAVLNQFGVQTASLIAVFGAAGLAIGLALQGTLSNVAAGVMLLIFRPLRVGQYVEVGGRAGTVKALDLFTTELATPDNIQIIMPNASVWGQPVVNYSHHATRRIEWKIGIGYGDSIDAAMTVLREVLAQDGRVLSDPSPTVIVDSLGDSSVNLIVWAWVNAADFGAVKWAQSKAFKEALDANGITIPFPQREIRVIGPVAAIPQQAPQGQH